MWRGRERTGEWQVVGAIVLTAWMVTPAWAQLGAGAVRGAVVDQAGAALPGVTIAVSSPSLVERTRSTMTDSSGRYMLPSLTPGVYTVTFRLQGFSTVLRENVPLHDGIAATIDATMRVGGVSETVTVKAEAPIVSSQAQQVTLSGSLSESETGGASINQAAGQNRRSDQASVPSQNVINLQQRAAGVLPVRVDVPRTGTSHQFVRLLVVDDATAVDLRYKRK